MRRRTLLAFTTSAYLLGCGGAPALRDASLDTATESGLDAATDIAPPDVALPDVAADAAADGGAAARYPGRDILRTSLQLDVTTHAATAVIDVAGSTTVGGVTLEIGDLTIASVTGAAGALTYATHDHLLEVDLPPGSDVATLTVQYAFRSEPRTGFDGWMPSPTSGTPTSGMTFLWPFFCGNLYPCHSAPSDGVEFSMAVTGVPAGRLAVYPTHIPADAPSYMPAVAVNQYTYLEIGITTAGTHVGVYYLPADATRATMGTARMRDIFDWYETTYGAYRFGDHVATVEADWGPSDYGGMEHHPFWHVDKMEIDLEATSAHEAAHGWFGDGVRLQCWEDFVLSEGTVSYLTTRAVEQVGGAAARDAIWALYSSELDAAIAHGDTQAYPATCNQIDILTDPLWSNIPYMKGAYFYRDVEAQIGRAALDHALRGFYLAHATGAATMQQMIDFIQTDSGHDVTPLVARWLHSLGRPSGS